MIRSFRDIPTCALLFILTVVTYAAPPPSSQSSDQLSLVNVNGSTRLSVGFPFTPGPQPSEKTIFYDVPYSNPRVNIKFRDYLLQRGRNENDVDRSFQQARIECGDVRQRNVEMEEESYSWESGQVMLLVEPRKGNHDQDVALTYGYFFTALRGLNDFRLFYPELDFGFEIYVYPYGPQPEFYVGLGQLRVEQT